MSVMRFLQIKIMQISLTTTMFTNNWHIGLGYLLSLYTLYGKHVFADTGQILTLNMNDPTIFVHNPLYYFS